MATARKIKSKDAPVAEAASVELVVKSIKGFDKNFRCREFQFAVGQTYEVAGKIEACNNGFHAIEGYPLEVFDYYSPGDGSIYADVTQGGALSRKGTDSKLASARITIDAEIKIPELVTRAFNWVLAQCVGETAKHSEGDRSASSATGYQSASSATGYRSASSATGDRSASSATGDQSASSATGYRSASSATGKAAVALNTGAGGRAKAAEGGAICLCFHDDEGNLIHIRAGKIGDDGLRPDTLYTLSADGEFVEVAA